MRIAFVYSGLVYNLSPDLELFKHSIDLYSTIERPTFDLSCQGEIDRLMEQRNNVDLLCIDHEVYDIMEDENPERSSTILFKRCLNEIPSKNIIKGCKTICEAKDKLNTLIASHFITSILYMPIVDPWLMTSRAYERSMEALVNKGMYIYYWEEQFMPNIPSPFFYTSLMRESNARNRFIPLRHSLDPSYDAKYTSTDKVFLINCMPSFKKNRLEMIKKLEKHMCPGSRKLLKASTKSILDLRESIIKIKKESGVSNNIPPELVFEAVQARDTARNNYKSILSKSKYIFTEAVNNSMVRKFIEVPYSGSILCSNENGWEKSILLNKRYPLLNLRKATLDVDRMNKSYEAYQSNSSLESISSDILESYSYKKRLKRLEMFFY